MVGPSVEDGGNLEGLFPSPFHVRCQGRQLATALVESDEQT